MDYPHKLKLHDTIVTVPRENDFYWHGKYFNTISSLSEYSSEELVSMIRDFLSKKERLNFYRLYHAGTDDGISYYRSFSDDDVAYIKKLFDLDIEKAIENEDEESDWYIKFPGYDTKPNDYIWELTACGSVYLAEPIQINLGRVVHIYAMSRSFCDVENGEIKRTTGFGVPLADEDYVYLVHEIITHDFEYFFTDLAMVETELAKKIYKFSMYSNPDLMEDYDVKHLPFLIRFDELEEDARKIVSMNTSPKVQL